MKCRKLKTNKCPFMGIQVAIFFGCVFSAQIITLVAQDRGNTASQEYGDAVYRELDGFAGFLGYDYNHTSIFAGFDSEHIPKVMQALGSGSVTDEVSFNDEFKSSAHFYYGAYTLNN